MAIKDFGSERASKLIISITKAWPWAATELGHEWWMSTCALIDSEAGVESVIEAQAIEFTGYDASFTKYALEELRRLRNLNLPEPLRSRVLDAYTTMGFVEHVLGMDNLDDEKFEKARDRATALVGEDDVGDSILQVEALLGHSNWTGHGDELVARMYP